jgi:uncharacterized protein GlcG (DUF336 family)
LSGRRGRRLGLPALLAGSLLSGSASAQDDGPALVGLRTLSHGQALAAVGAATEACAEAGYHVATAVVGRDGRLLALLRMPLSGPHTIDVAQRKAYTALTYQSPTMALSDRSHLAHTPGVLLIGGGLPIEAAGAVVGAIGVSGAPGQERPGDVDERCANAGLSAIAEELEFAQ